MACPKSCTCACSILIKYHAYLVILLATLILLSALALFLFDPLLAGQFDLILSFQTIELALLASGIYTLISGIVGVRFAVYRLRRTGLVYLILFTLGVACQLFAFSHLVVSEKNLELFEDLTGVNLNSSDTEQLLDEVSKAQQRSLQQAWIQFEETTRSYECTMASSDNASSTEQRCRKGQREVTCDKNSNFASGMTRTCSIWSSASISDQLPAECSTCLATYIVAANLEEGLTENQKKVLHERFDGMIGTMFCRCMAANFARAKEIEDIIFWVSLVYTVLLVLLLLSILWLLLCGPPPDETKSELKGSFAHRDSQYSMDEGVELVQVVCPPGASPGTLIRVTAPSGRQREVLVPQGAYPGMILQAYV